MDLAAAAGYLSSVALLCSEQADGGHTLLGTPLSMFSGDNSTMVDAELQRKNMVESQVRPSDVTDRRIIRSMLDMPRERFVPAASRAIAYMDNAVPLSDDARGGAAGGRYLMDARTFAKLTQLADISDDDIVLDVGTATGYSAAVLSRLCETVVALESDASMTETATALLKDQSIDNVVVVNGALEKGYADEGPFDAIIVEGAIESLPDGLLDQLKDGGRLVAVVDDGAISHAVVWRRIGASFDKRIAFEAGAPRLIAFDKPKTFAF